MPFLPPCSHFLHRRIVSLFSASFARRQRLTVPVCELGRKQEGIVPTGPWWLLWGGWNDGGAFCLGGVRIER